MKLIGDLVIEITRKCNTICDHCLRGESENKEISYIAMEETLKQFDRISNITFTGGEPSLNPEAIQHFLSICKSKRIEVGSFYIATNAIHASDEFVKSLLDLWLYCDEMVEDEIGGVAISNDFFHTPDSETVKRLKAFKFTNLRYSEKRKGFYDGSYLINEGFQYDNMNEGRILEPENFDYLDLDEFKESGYFQDIKLYLNCKGQIILGCDWSYQNQEDHVLCNATESIFDSIGSRKEDINNEHDN